MLQLQDETDLDSDPRTARKEELHAAGKRPLVLNNEVHQQRTRTSVHSLHGMDQHTLARVLTITQKPHDLLDHSTALIKQCLKVLF